MLNELKSLLSGKKTFFILFLVFLSGKVFAGNFTWTTKAPMITARVGLLLLESNGKLYAIGGNGNTNTYATVEEYDPLINFWTTRNGMPVQRDFMAGAVVFSKIYVFGGGGGGYYNSVYEYANNIWTAKASMLTSRNQCAASVFNNKIYVAGGENNSGTLNTFEEYDPTSDTWNTKNSMPRSRKKLSAVVVGTKFYAIGGIDKISNVDNYLKTYDVYDFTTGQWDTTSNKPEMAYVAPEANAVYVNNKIYVINNGLVFEFDPSLPILSWVQKNGPSVQRGSCGATIGANNKVYLAGGYGNGTYLTLLEEATWDNSLSSGTNIPNTNTGGSASDINSAYCYPVPANLSRGDTIKFVNLTGSAKVRILTTSGVTVKELDADSSGYIVPWNGTDNNGSKIATGTYIVHAFDGPTNKAKIFKIIIIK